MRLTVLWLVLLLVACSPSQKPTSAAPAKSCGATGFTCYVLARSPRDVGLMLQNTVGTDLSSVTVTLTTTDCALQQATIAVGPMPAHATTPVHFTCADNVPDQFSGKLLVAFTANGGAVAQTVNGSVSISH